LTDRSSCVILIVSFFIDNNHVKLWIENISVVKHEVRLFTLPYVKRQMCKRWSCKLYFC